MRRAGLSLAIAVGVAQAATAEIEGALTPDETRVVAQQLLGLGQSREALALAEALLQRDPNDFVALLVKARALRDLGRLPEAKTAAAAAWNEARTDDERFAAAMIRAQVLSSAGNKTYAQLWLRRAVENAPTEQLENIAIRDFKYVRATNPWSTRFSFGITPDSNINNGSASETSFLNYQQTELLFGEPLEYQLTGSALALSGVEFSARLDTRYRFWQTETRAQDIFLSLDYRHYELTQDAKNIAPDVKGSDFDFQSIFLGYGFRGFNFDKRGEFAFRADLGTSWYGYDEYARYLRGSVIQSYALSHDTRINARLAGERQYGITTADIDTVKAEVWAARFFQDGKQLRLALHAAQAQSPTPAEEFTEFGVGASLVLGQLFEGTGVQLGLSYRTRDYDVSPHSPDGRQDNRVTADVTFIFDTVDYYGFNPTMTLYVQDTASNIALYDAQRFGVNFGIQSAF